MNRDELEDIIWGEGLAYHIENGWLDPDQVAEIQDEELRTDIQAAMAAWDLFGMNVRNANDRFDRLN